MENMQINKVILVKHFKDKNENGRHPIVISEKNAWIDLNGFALEHRTCTHISYIIRSTKFDCKTKTD